MLEKKIYRIGRSLGLDKNDIDTVIKTPHKISSYTPTADIYKNGTDYGTVSPIDVYKIGSKYGTISSNDF